MNKLSNLLILLLLTVVGYFVYDNYKRDKFLKGKTAITKAIVTRLTKPGVRSPARIYYLYKVKENELIDFDHGSDTKLKKGDTILIKYSIKNPSYSKIQKLNF